MDEETFTYAMLRRIERAENTSPRLQKLEARFWERLGEHLTKLRQAFQDQQEEDPTSRRTVVLADELRNTQRLAESIWGFREKKVVQGALAATRKREGKTEPPEHTTAEERHLFETVCGVLQRARDEAALTDPFSRRRQSADAAERAAQRETPPVPEEAAQRPAPQTARHTSEEAEAGVPRAVTGPPPVPAAAARPSGGVERGPEGGREPDAGQRPGQSPGGHGVGGSAGETQAQAPAHSGRGGVGTSGGDEVALRLVQALADVPLFAGLDLVEYELAKGEIGNLPTNAAEALSKRGIVRLLPA